jgi:hypothetical protein
MFAGEVYFRFSGGANFMITLNPVPATDATANVIMGGSALLNESPTAEFETTIILPRSPTQLVITNNDGANPHTFNFEMVALR